MLIFLALGPALTVLFIPIPAFGTTTALMMAGAGSAYALLSTLHDMARSNTHASDHAPLLKRRLSRSTNHDLPPLAEMRAQLDCALTPPADDAEPGMPIRQDHAIAQALRFVLRGWNCTGMTDLTPAEITELYLFDCVLRRPSGEAGALAQLFHRPDAILEIRDDILSTTAAREAALRQQALFDATCRIWHMTEKNAQIGSLLTALQALRMPDLDLWHRIVVEHDPTNADARAAALWCLKQPSCDQATVACYFARIATEGHLLAAARLGDADYLKTVRSLITAWNDGVYETDQLGLAPPDCLIPMAPEITAAFDALAHLLSPDTAWPEPAGFVRAYSGRPLKPRAHWCLSTGTLLEPPKRSDYVDLTVTQVA